MCRQVFPAAELEHANYWSRGHKIGTRYCRFSSGPYGRGVHHCRVLLWSCHFTCSSVSTDHWSKAYSKSTEFLQIPFWLCTIEPHPRSARVASNLWIGVPLTLLEEIM